MTSSPEFLRLASGFAAMVNFWGSLAHTISKRMSDLEEISIEIEGDAAEWKKANDMAVLCYKLESVCLDLAGVKL